MKIPKFFITLTEYAIYNKNQSLGSVEIPQTLIKKLAEDNSKSI